LISAFSAHTISAIDFNMAVSMRVTLKDVAKAADVSVATASRALAGGGLTNERTQQRLSRIAEEMGYRPNPIARGLRVGRSGLIGLVLHNLNNASFQIMAEVVQARFQALGYQTLLCIAGDDPEQELATLDTLTDHRVDGLIVVPTGKNGARLVAAQKRNTPLVCIIRRDGEGELETVLADDPQGAYAGTQYLIGLGHKRIGLIVGRMDTTSGQERLSGYLRALREAGIVADESLIHSGHFSPETGESAARTLLALPERPTAIFVANHESALGVFRVIAELGLTIPDDLSLLCYEDVPWFAWHRPAISVVDSGPRELANLAVDRLLQRISGKDEGTQEPPREYRVGSRLVKRDSCRAPSVSAGKA
jgi:LacI family transcriptional regulator